MNNRQLPSVEECLKKFLEKTEPILETEEVILPNAYKRVLAEDIIAKINVPAYPKSAMDGYAVCARDIEGATRETPAVLTVAGEILAGDFKEIPYSKNAAVRVMTGGFIPKGFDCVIMQEDTDFGEDKVSIYRSVKPKTNYCEIGEDIKAGMVVIKKGKMLDSMDIGILASIGVYNVKVVKKMRVAIISTGTEIQFPYETLMPGKIYNNTAYILSTAINEGKFLCDEIIAVKDDERLLEEAIEKAARFADMIITTGAVSVGKRDIVPAVLNSMGAEHLFDHADIQPGTPTAGNVYKNTLILSLSGNPYAAIANFELYFWNIAAKMMRCDSIRPKREVAILMSEYNKLNKHRRLIRAYAENGRVYIPENTHASSVVSNMTNCNCFIDLQKQRSVNIGDNVEIQYIKIK